MTDGPSGTLLFLKLLHNQVNNQLIHIQNLQTQSSRKNHQKKGLDKQ